VQIIKEEGRRDGERGDGNWDPFFFPRERRFFYSVAAYVAGQIDCQI
jgi:hypothetical protein